jgi:LDH2 family malate/lactate/ureidoglycolate dehydrogenase
MALNPDCFIGREHFKKSMDTYINSIKESGRAKNKKEILMPGEPEYRTESQRLKDGIPLPLTTLNELTALGESFGLSLPLMD